MLIENYNSNFMNLFSIRNCVCKGIFRMQAAAWFCALPLILGFSQVTLATQEAIEHTPQPPGEATTQKLPEVRVGELNFKVTSLRVSDEELAPGSFERVSQGNATMSRITITLAIENRGKKPIALNYVEKSVSFVNEFGYTWEEKFLYNAKVSGLPVATNDTANVDYIIDPGSELRATISLSLPLKRGQTTGSIFNFQSVFSSYENLGEGRLRKLRSYPVSFIGLKKFSIPDSAAADLKGGVNGVEVNLKNALGRFFGN